jgi:hypothetical protein
LSIFLWELTLSKIQTKEFKGTSSAKEITREIEMFVNKRPVSAVMAVQEWKVSDLV